MKLTYIAALTLAMILYSERSFVMAERTGLVTLKGNPLTLLGNEVKVGQAAPDATLVANDLSEVKLSSLLKGKRTIIAAVPSLDTPVCDTETRRFNKEAASLGEDVSILVISMDLPFAQKRWCGAAGIDKLKTLSDHRDASFGNAYGVLVKNVRILARSIFVIDENGKVAYTQIVKEVATEPDYDAALQALKKLPSMAKK
jgi:thiol peroxidase